MLRKHIISILLVILTSFVTACNAKTDPNANINVAHDKYDLKPQSYHWLTCRAITNVILHYDFKKVKLDDQLSALILDTYLTNLDPSKVIFIKQDIDSFNKHKYKLDDDLKNGNLQAAYSIYNLFLTRYIQVLDFIDNELSTSKFNLLTNETLEINRKDANWMANINQNKEYWHKKLTYDIITQKLLDKTDTKKAINTVKKRYDNIRRYLLARKSDDVFEIYMNSFAETVEPHTSYLSAKSADQFKIDMSKSLEGIGATLRTEDEYTKIEEVIKGGPAYKSKQLESGDRIIAVAQGQNGEFEDIRGLFVDEVVQKIRGKKGTVVKLRVLPNGSSSTTAAKEVTIIRDKIVVEEQKVSSKLIETNYNNKSYKIGIIIVPSFYIDWEAMNKGDKNYNSSSNDVKKEIEKLKKQNIQGLIVDLRNNGGGSLPEAINLTGLFVGQGPVVQIKESSHKIQSGDSDVKQPIYKGPLLVLTNRFSASASEIFAGAIQDYNRGIIVGGQTYGKGTVQTILNVADDILGEKNKNFGQLNITIAQFYRVNGASTQSKGVIPDIEFPSKYPDTLFGENANKNALPYNSISPTLYTQFPNLSDSITRLIQLHNDRMVKSEEYNFLKETINKLKKARDRKEIVLNEKELQKENEKEAFENLNQYNKRRKLLNLKPVKKGEKRPKLEYDFLKEEGIKILIDFVSLNNKNLHN
ncbi:MAG: carboxy terminal-processing peptidase [Solitalea-like symbiont of Tyrophagus putrescentiae]